MMQIETTIPFSGFYDSIHSSALECELDQMFEQDEELQEKQDLCNWPAVFDEYSQYFVDLFAAEFDLKTLHFNSFYSPREYNFGTDKIYCMIAVYELKEVISKTRKSAWKAWVLHHCSNQPGFASFYSNDANNWPVDLAEWEPAQVGLLINCYIWQETNHSDNWEQDLIEPLICNGIIHSIISANIPDD